MFVARTLAELGGAARYGDLVAQGATQSVLKRARQAGIITHPLYGTYALPSASRGVILAAAYRARLTCVSACDEVGLPLLTRTGAVHLVVPRDRARRADDRRPTKAVVLHRDDELWERAGDHSVATAIDAAGACIDRLGQLALCDAALRLGLVSRDDLLAFSATSKEQLRWLVEHADPRAHAITETYLRIRLVEAGFSVVPQFEVGPNHHCDFLVEGCVAIEVDGKGTHLNEGAFQDDRARDRAVIRRGFVPLRYTFDDIFGRWPADIVADVRAAKLIATSGSR